MVLILNEMKKEENLRFIEIYMYLFLQNVTLV